MEVSSQDPSPMAMDLSKGYSVNSLTRSHTEAMDLAKKPEWYHRRPPSCSTEVSSPYSTRSRAASSYNSLSGRMMDGSRGDGGVIQLHPEAGGPVHCRDMEQGAESLGGYMNSTLAQGLGLYHEGVHGNLWHPGFYRPDQAGGPIPESSGGEESDSGSDVIFLVSSAKDSLLCSSFIQESVSRIVEPLSPAAPSLDEGRGCYLLPQPLSSPSPDSTYSEDSSDSSADIPVHHTRPIVLLSDLNAVYGNNVESLVDISSDDSDVIEVSVTNEKKKSHTSFPGKIPCKKSLVGEMRQQSEAGEPQPRELRRSSRIRKPVSVMPIFTRSVSQHNLRSKSKNATVGLYNESYDSDDMIESVERLSSSEAESVLQPRLTQRVSSHSDDSDADSHTDCKSPSESPQSKSPYGQQSCRRVSPVKTMKRKRKKSLTVQKTKRLRTKQKSHQKPPPRQHSEVSPGRKRAVNKSAVTRRRRKRHSQSGPSALFSPREPEIKLKYAKLKEEKKEGKSDSFRPFVHMERTVCTVVNYQEEEVTVRCKGGQHQTATGSLSGFVPKTSCFHLGRLRTESKCQSTQVCCLCGQTANAMGLGDLHGPYYPTGSSVDCQSHQQNCTELPQEEKKSREKEEEELHGLNNSHEVNSADECYDNDGSTVPSVMGSPENDSHSLPKVPLYRDECWIHEDCGIWSAGVFLVRGRLYGVGEAARLAQETVCATCQKAGAIMGCFQKGCARSYHYRCAIQTGCVLNEDNFSMRCPEHKNKPLTCVTRQHRR
ncbi:uncharacterized protein LOC115363643 [Myripristis murdjan]|uniref:Uncharacterized LOC115363643 n=1 Tax=Myripristis murdjan TaxID=586833 RepID=A0A667YTI0_9TELE|nr:uncharacterized protein LOC115363643 [Myripristis murdjan]